MVLFQPTRDDDAGFTLVELIVSLTVLAIGIVGVIGVMNSAFGVAVRTNERSRAVALATRELEALRAVRYDKLDVVPTAETRTEKVGGTTFTIEKAITWGSQGANANAVKYATVDVAWLAGAQVHDVSETTTVYPGGLGPSATPTTSACGSGGTPNGPVAFVAGAPGVLTANSVDLAWTPPTSSATAIATWRVDMSTNSFAATQTITTTQPVSSVALRIEGLSADTTYQFRVAGVSACGIVSPWSPIATARTLVAVATQCALGTPNVTPSGVKRQSSAANSGLASSPTVSVNTTGNCAGLYVKYQAVAGVDRTQLLGGSAVKTVGITASGAWDIGVHTLDLFDGNNVIKGSLLLTVCAHNANQC